MRHFVLSDNIGETLYNRITLVRHFILSVTMVRHSILSVNIGETFYIIDEHW